MHRFFADKSQFGENSVTLIGDDVGHITKVLRLKEGDLVTVCDKDKTDYTCKVDSWGKDFVNLSIVSKEANPNESELYITLYQGLPKSDKLEYIIQKSIELGADKIVPVVTSRTVVKLKDNSKKLDRWQKIAEQAAKQSMRGIVPEVSEPIDFKTMLGELSSDALTIIAYENEKQTKLKTVLEDNKDKLRVNIIIGPEGGFEEDEVRLASEAGAKSVTLGPRILRCETAPIAVISAVMYEKGDW